MQVRALAASGVLIGAASLALGLASPAAALPVCDPDSYSGACPTPPAQGGGSSGVGGSDQKPGSGTDQAPGGNTGGTGQEPGGSSTGGSNQNPGSSTVSNPATLPFTGGELVLLTALGAGALAGGTALVVAGRRKPGTAA